MKYGQRKKKKYGFGALLPALSGAVPGLLGKGAAAGAAGTMGGTGGMGGALGMLGSAAGLRAAAQQPAVPGPFPAPSSLGLPPLGVTAAPGAGAMSADPALTRINLPGRYSAQDYRDIRFGSPSFDGAGTQGAGQAMGNAAAGPPAAGGAGTGATPVPPAAPPGNAAPPVMGGGKNPVGNVLGGLNAFASAELNDRMTEGEKKSNAAIGAASNIASMVPGGQAVGIGLQAALLAQKGAMALADREAVVDPVTGRTEFIAGNRFFDLLGSPIGAGARRERGDMALYHSNLKKAREEERRAGMLGAQRLALRQQQDMTGPSFGAMVPNSGTFMYGKKGGTMPKIAFFAYSHMMDDKKVSELAGKKVKGQEHHLDGYKMTMDRKGEPVIRPDRGSTVKGKKYILDPGAAKRITEAVKGYKKHMVGGNSPSYDIMFTFYGKGGRVDKDSMPCNKPKRTPGHPTKSHVVKACKDGKEKLIRFGQQGVEGAGKDPASEKEKARRRSYYARHNAQDSDPDKFSARYWSHKVKWSEGGPLGRPEDAPLFKMGGIIAGGVGHGEKNRIGDKGVPVVPLAGYRAKGGKYDPSDKLAEIESMELVFNVETAEEIERLVEGYKRTKDGRLLEEAGRLVKEALQNVTDETCRTGCRFGPEMKGIKGK